jgi:hypothetical protein
MHRWLAVTVVVSCFSAGRAGAEEGLAARLARVEAELAGLREENRALRETMKALAEARQPPREGQSTAVLAIALPSLPPAAPAETGPRIKAGGLYRVRPEYRNRLRADAAGRTSDAYAGQRARLYLSASTERLQAYVEVQDARNWGTETSTLSNDGNADLHQAYLHVPDMGMRGLSLTAGRQELVYGDERLIGPADWLTVGRSFDGGVLRRAWKGGSVDVFGALLNDRRTAARGSGDVVLGGVYARLLRGRPGRELDVYTLNLGDGAAASGESPGLDDSRVTTYGFRARFAPAHGAQASLEAAVQTGHRGPDDHEAHAWAATAGYVFDRRFKPLLRVEWDEATGDGHPRDARATEFNNLFPTNHAHYGYADLLGWRNMQALRGTLALAPMTGHLLSADLHRFRLREAGGAWKDAGGEVLGHDPSGAAGRDIGHEVDLLYRFPLRKQLTILTGYSAFFPGRFARTVRGPGTQHFGYAQALFKF